jgi:hypothetical protein
MKTHSSETEYFRTNKTDKLFEDEYIKPSKTERKSQNKKQKRQFQNLVRQGRFDSEDVEDFLE